MFKNPNSYLSFPGDSVNLNGLLLGFRITEYVNQTYRTVISPTIMVAIKRPWWICPLLDSLMSV